METITIYLHSVGSHVAMTDALKAATTATLQDETMLSIELATSETLHLPLYGEASDRAVSFFDGTSHIETRELEIDTDDLELTLIGPKGELSVPATDDALKHHSEFFEDVGLAG